MNGLLIPFLYFMTVTSAANVPDIDGLTTGSTFLVTMRRFELLNVVDCVAECKIGFKFYTKLLKVI